MSTADLTVLIPNYNHAKYLPRSLGAIFAQSVQPREVLVIDDGSKDDSLAVLESFAKKHPTLRVLRNERNMGVNRTLNRGMALTDARYLLSAASDDYVLPGFFEKAATLMERHPTAGLCFGNDAYQVGDHGPVEPNPGVWPPQPDFYDAAGVCRYMRNTIPGHATIFRTQALKDIGGYPLGLEWYGDWFVNLALAFRHGACHIPEPVAIRVLLDTSYSAASKSAPRNIPVLRAFFDEIAKPEYADVAPWFRKSGSAIQFGTDLIRGAASHPDLWQPQILGFLNGFTRWEYRELLDDPDPTVRDVASFFLGPFWQREDEQYRTAVEAPLRLELDAVRCELPPVGTAGKVKWLAALAIRKLARTLGARKSAA